MELYEHKPDKFGNSLACGECLYYKHFTIPPGWKRIADSRSASCYICGRRLVASAGGNAGGGE